MAIRIERCFDNTVVRTMKYLREMENLIFHHLQNFITLPAFSFFALRAMAGLLFLQRAVAYLIPVCWEHLKAGRKSETSLCHFPCKITCFLAEKVSKNNYSKE